MAGHLLCIAIPVPEPWGRVVDEARRRLQPARRHMSAHITIIPPFRVAGEALDALLDDVTRDLAACDPFIIELRGTATFDGASKVVFLPVVAGSGECVSLRDRLMVRLGSAVGLDATGLDTTRHPMVPHVTIVNRADAATMEAAAAEFDGFEAGFQADRGCVYQLGEEGWTNLRAAGFLGIRALPGSWPVEPRCPDR